MSFDENNYDSQNIFAKILRGEFNCHKVYEDEHTIAFMDIMPQAPGHTLVVPKESAINLFDLSPDAAAASIQIVQKIARAVKQAMNADGIRIAQFNGPAAGQSVPHIHFHIVPAMQGQPLKVHAQEMEKEDVLVEHANKIRAVLGE